MTPVDFEGTNLILTKPDGYTDEQCGSLPVKQTKLSGSAITYLIKYRLSDIDLINLQNGSFVVITVYSDFPVTIGVDTKTISANDHFCICVVNNVLFIGLTKKQVQQVTMNRTLWVRLTSTKGFPPISVETRLMHEKN